MPRGGRRTNQTGRPRLPTRRTVRKAVNFTPEEWERIEAAIRRSGGRASEFMREAVLEKVMVIEHLKGERRRVKYDHTRNSKPYLDLLQRN